MRLLIQRVREGRVTVGEEILGETGHGFVLFLGVTETDSEKEVDYLVSKCVNLRVFEDENGKMNRSLLDFRGDALIVSQFTLYADCVKGRRPGFDHAARPELAEPLYELFVEKMRSAGIGTVATGRFGADMLVHIENDGPATFLLESRSAKDPSSL